MSTEQQRRYWRMTSQLKRDMEKVGMQPSRHDPDYIVASLMAWLDKENAALTGKGVRRFRR